MGFPETPSHFNPKIWSQPNFSNQPQRVNWKVQQMKWFPETPSHFPRESGMPSLCWMWAKLVILIEKKIVLNLVIGFPETASHSQNQYATKSLIVFLRIWNGLSFLIKSIICLFCFPYTPYHCLSMCSILMFGGDLGRGPNPRSLDGDLGSLCKAGEEFNWERISFVLEAGISESIIWTPAKQIILHY